MITRICFLLFAFTYFSSSTFAQANLEKELLSFVSRLNEKFSLDVELKKVYRCGFSSGSDHSISYCQRNIDFFRSLGSDKKSLESILTIIAHEYAHILLNYTMSSSAEKALEDSLAESTEAIYRYIQFNARRRAQIGRFIEANFSSEEQDQEAKVKEAILKILLLGDHENMDSMGAKIMIIVGSSPRPEVMDLFPQITGNNQPHIFDLVKARKEVLRKSTEEHLNSWNNYTCVGAGRDFTDSNIALKKVLAQNGFNAILNKLNNGCSTDDVLKTFLDILDRYYP